MSGAKEMYELAADLAAVPARAVVPMREVFSEAGDLVADLWAENARATSGVHGKHYPESIDSELNFSAGGIEVEVGPNSAKPQGVMGRGFEFGGKNQRPHLDGLRATEFLEPVVETMVVVAVDRVIP